MLTRLPRRQLALLVFAWAAAATVVASLVVAGRETALDRGRRSSAAFAFMVELQTAQALQAAQLTLSAVVDAWRLHPGLRENDPSFQGMLVRRLQEVPLVRAISLLDRAGSIVHDTDYPRTPDVAHADRAYFRAHEQDWSLEHSISAPEPGPSSDGWSFAVSRSLGSPGEFQGLAVAAVQTDYFRRQFEKINLAGDDVIALFHESGVLLARHPLAQEMVGRSFAGSPLFSTHLPRQPAGIFVHTAAPGLLSEERVAAYRAVSGTPFVVLVSRSNWDLLAEWRRTAVGAAVAMGALTVLLAFFIGHLLREQRRQELLRERSAQAEKLEALGQLTGGVAHDFGNVLSIISVNLTLLRHSLRETTAAEEPLAVTERAVRRGSELIWRLGRFSKREPLRVMPLDLGTAVAGAHALLAQAAGPRIVVTIERAGILPKVLCDESELDMALLNLVVNARDAIAGAGRISVRTYSCDPDAAPARTGGSLPGICVAVQDSGAGMSEEVRRRALEPYFTTKGERGTGLGLSQVYGFMQRLGGSLHIDSAPGKGTTIRLFFPVAARQ